MDKNEYNVKLAQINQMIEEGDYAEAAAIADQIDWKRVRNVRTLCLISEVYEAVDRYEDSKTILLRAYRRSSVGRSILYRLVEVTIKLKQFDEAIEFYSEYVQAAPGDANQYILKYKIYRGRGSSVEEQIEIMKELLDHEYSEQYAYKLAELYLEADRIQECLATCDDLVLWFHSGKYVIKALELKKRYAPLTPKQQEIYDRRFDEPEIPVHALREELETENQPIGQEKQIVDTTDATLAETIMEDMEKSIADEVARVTGETQVFDTEAVKAAREAAALEEVKAEIGNTTIIDVAKISEAAADDDIKIAAPVRTAEDPAAEADETAMTKETETAVVSDTEETEAAAERLETMNVSEPEAELTPEEILAEELSSFTQMTFEGEEDAPETEAIEEAIEPAEPETDAAVEAEPQPVRTPQEIQSDMLKNMREIVAGVGLRDLVDEEQEAKNQIIEDSKQDQEKALAAQAIRMSRKLSLPELQKRQAAGQLSIDDVLISMGDKGAHVRETVKDIHQIKPAKAGVLSAVDEALLNMGAGPASAAAPEEIEADEISAEMKELYGSETSEELPGTEEENTAMEAEDTVEEDVKIADEAVSEEANAVAAESVPTGNTQDLSEVGRALAEAFGDEKTEEASEEVMEQILDDAPRTSEANQNLSMDEIRTAKTRRIPTEEISQRQAEFEENVRKNLEESEAEAAANAEASGNAQAAAAQQAQMPQMWLKKELRGLFDGYLGIADLERQIASAIEQVMQKGEDRTSRAGNVLIFGGHGCGKTTIATGLAKAIAAERGSQSVKMAKIYATDLNRKDIAATLAKIAGGVLIVEEAGDLEDAVADQLTTAME